MDFYHWLICLSRDCVKLGISHRLRADCVKTWAKVWSAGVPPSVESICRWAVADPERWEDLRETEVFDDRMAA